MSNNEHNAIAARISKLQNLWMEQREQQKSARLWRWHSAQEDFVLVNSFLKLESSPYGKTEDTFVVFFNDFENREQYTYELTREWLTVFEKEAEENPGWQWADFPVLKNRFEKLDPVNDKEVTALWRDLLVSFKQFEGKKNNLLLVGLIPRNAYDQAAFSAWILNLLHILPDNIGFVITDFEEKQVYRQLMDKAGKLGHTVILPDQNMKGAYKELATQGNPNDPQVQFRKCMFEMGEAAARKDRKRLKTWGEKMLDVTQATGQRSFWASAHLIYAGFLFRFKNNEKIHALLDKGIKIVKPEYMEKPESAGVLLQLYAYKGSYYSMCGEKENALESFLKQVETAKQAEMKEQAVLAYKNALVIAKKQGGEKYKNIAGKAYQEGYPLESDTLKALSFSFIADHYLKTGQASPEEEKEINQRMTTIFGEDWRSISKPSDVLEDQTT